ncbi:uncharacterized protein PV09_06213 [Verruconis gallopava]|uniref:Uncharacterized protein n=1 Tax=Verruconis gallopava TaxID=253628 RepID=A0A0D2A6N8_9PEZI|nr:uncharacterized protein PV09_06213 [Verruconis gallopava]KIW02393.1 hypothetical protein PV09_06213 [Verruconis gallopava]
MPGQLSSPLSTRVGCDVKAEVRSSSCEQRKAAEGTQKEQLDGVVHPNDVVTTDYLNVQPRTDDANKDANNHVHDQVPLKSARRESLATPVFERTRGSSQIAVHPTLDNAHLATCDILYENFMSKPKPRNLPAHEHLISNPGKVQLKAEVNCQPEGAGAADDHFHDLSLSPSQKPLVNSHEDENYNYDDDWEKIESCELDAHTNDHSAIPSVVYQHPSFRATIQEYVDKYRLTEEQRQTLRGLWAMAKLVSEFGYSVVSEPIVDIADWAVDKQFGCHIEDLPLELRSRFMASLPEKLQKAIRTTNRKLRRGGGFVVPPAEKIDKNARDGDQIEN